MSVLNNIRLFFQRRALRQILERQPARNGHMHYDEARHLGLLFNASELNAREKVLKFAEGLRQHGKKVSLLGFFDHPVESSDFLFSIYTEKDFDWMLRPKSEAVQKFVNEPFDLLLHADTECDMYAACIAAASKAKLRVGPYTGRTECYELMADISGSRDLTYYLKQVEFLLQKTNARHEAA
jgi:hypothetical protein